ncbi:hypothetical protein FRC10_006736 [Ceratobasidium sp. 414]|nr:hypothetical protein FRC10_006736 [Ceratobasidium sp. 414]
MMLARAIATISVLFAPLLVTALVLARPSQPVLSQGLASNTPPQPGKFLNATWHTGLDPMPLNKDANWTIAGTLYKELGEEIGVRMVGYKLFDNGWRQYFEQESLICEDFEFANGPKKCPIPPGDVELAFGLTMFRDEQPDTSWVLDYLVYNKSCTPEEYDYNILYISLSFDLTDFPTQ